jgi:hypothetical protein
MNTAKQVTAKELIEYYEKQGFRVEINHSRYSQETFRQIEKTRVYWGVANTKSFEAKLLAGHTFSTGPSREYAPRGGATTVQLIRDGKVYTGTAHCSIADNFNRQTGITNAFKRASRNYADGIYLADQKETVGT